jgi:hypothetical protein
MEMLPSLKNSWTLCIQNHTGHPKPLLKGCANLIRKSLQCLEVLDALLDQIANYL